MFETTETGYAIEHPVAKHPWIVQDAILIAEARHRVAAGLPAYEPSPEHYIQVGSYFLPPGSPTDVIEIVAEQVEREAYIRLMRRRGRILPTAPAPMLAKGLPADHSEWGADDARG